jgi:hypothetical protein
MYRRFTTLFLYALAALCLISLVLTAGYVLAQKTDNVEWLGWAVVGQPSTSPDPGIYGKRPPLDRRVREDIELGLREDGVVVWRRVQTARGQERR